MAELSWSEQQEIASRLDERLWSRVASQVCVELFKEVRPPRDDDERQSFSTRLSRVRGQSRLWSFEPHPKQWWYLRAENALKLFLGSNQSGKTTAIIVVFLTWLLGYRPWLLGKPEDGVDRFGRRYGDLPVLSPRVLELGGVFRPIQALLGAKDFVNSVTEVLVPKISELVPLDLLKLSYDKVQGKTIHKIHFWNYSTWKFFSYEAEDEKVEGPTWDLAGFDEPPTRGHYVAVRRGCMAKSAPVLFSMTLLKEPWIHEELFSRSVEVVDDESFERSQRIEDASEGGRPSTIFSVLVDLDENPYLTSQQKLEFISTLRPDEIEVRVHGRPRHLMGRIYSRFRKELHVTEVSIGEGWPVGMVMDPHSRRPFAIAWYAVNPRDEIIFFKEWPNEDTPGWPTGPYGPLLYHQIQEWPWGVREYLEEIHRLERGFSERVWWRDMDPNYGRTKSAATGRTLQQDFDRDYVLGALSGSDEVIALHESVGKKVEGLRFRCDVDNDIERGHLAVKERLVSGTGEPMLFVTPDCVNLIHGFEHYTWNEYKSHDADHRAAREQPREKYKDFMDLVRYACVRDPRWFDLREAEMSIDPSWLAAISRGGLGS